MRDNLFKKTVKALFFRDGAVRRIRLGPLAGLKYKVSGITGLSAWYSGPEREHHTAFQQLVSPGDVVIDIGANWGLHTLYLSKLVGTNGRVIAVEPFAAALRELEWHVRENDCRNVQIVAAALSNTNGKAAFTPGHSAYTGHLSVIDSSTSAPHSNQTVETRTLDSLVDDLALERVRLIKLDVEGAESLVLGGASETLRKLAPLLIVDLHTPEQDLAVATILTGHAYKLERLSGPPIRHVDKGWPHQDGVWGSILATPAR